jgi:hypothetical protein
MLVSPGVEPGTTTGTGHLWGRMDTAASVPPHSPTDVVVPEIAAPGLRSVLTLVVVLSRWSPVVFLSVSGQRHGRAGENRCAICHLSSSIRALGGGRTTRGRGLGCRGRVVHRWTW